jgi:ABC-type uncharacterized transport system substrate-binding protein
MRFERRTTLSEPSAGCTGSLTRLLAAGAGVLIALWGTIVPAAAHPHVFVTAREQVHFDRDGRVASVETAWTFDDMYSAFVTQGLGDPGQVLTREQLAPVAKTNVESLEEFGWFTVGKTGGKAVVFDKPVDYWLEESADKLVTLHFTLPLKAPTKMGPFLSLQVYDPTYFVAFDYANTDPVLLAEAPAGCSVSVSKPKPLDNTDSQKLSEAFFTNMSPGTDFGIKLAPRAIVACP